MALIYKTLYRYRSQGRKASHKEESTIPVSMATVASSTAFTCTPWGRHSCTHTTMHNHSFAHSIINQAADLHRCK
jgi:hypothetical protein